MTKRNCFILWVFIAIFCISSVPVTASELPLRSVRPDTWAAVDGLGRTVCDYSQVGDVRKDKFVGMFYWSWHNHFSGSPARNVSQIISQYPEARNDFDHIAWEGTPAWTPFFWNEPIWGYYRTTDRYVLRKQAELLADAGVDVIFFDCTNDTYTFKDAYQSVFREFKRAKNEGVRVPQIAFVLNLYSDANAAVQLRDLYGAIYKNRNFEDLWFYWEGKPLIVSRSAGLKRSNSLDREILEFFTFRKNPRDYYLDSTDYSDKLWGWLSVYPQTKFGVREDGTVEQMCVSTAQNSNQTEVVAMNDYLNRAQGRGFAKGNYSYQYTYANRTITVRKDMQDAYLYGLNFQQQWDYAIEVDPDFIFVTGWNEFVGQRQELWKGTEGAFTDNFNDEFSRDIEPSKGILKDHFYYQLVDNIRKFKGVGKPETATADKQVGKTIDIFSSEDLWSDISLSFDHYTGSTKARNSAGYKDLTYRYDTMRNDIVTSKVAYDTEYIYFMVETAKDLSPSSDHAWMRLLLDTDPTGVTPNWEGFEYILNRTSPTGNEAIVERSAGGWKFEQAGTAKFSVTGRRLQIAVPRSVVGLTDTRKISFNFKWADNTIDPKTTQDSGDILDYYLYGDVAPGGRFMFAFNTEASMDAPPVSNASGSGIPAYVWWIVGVCAVFAVGPSILYICRRCLKKTE